MLSTGSLSLSFSHVLTVSSKVYLIPARFDEDHDQLVGKQRVLFEQAGMAKVVGEKDLIAIKRPGTGLPPSMRPYLIGRTARTTIPAGTLLTLEMLA